MEEDFYIGPDGTAATEFWIDCILSDFTTNEAKNFIEYLTYEKDTNGIHYILELHYHAWKEGNRIFSELRAGKTGDGVAIDGKARELLKVVYLRPLRDAEREMSAGRNSRISQILFSHPVFQNKDEHRLIQIFNDANSNIENYFAGDEDGKVILKAIRDNLEAFNERGASHDASL